MLPRAILVAGFAFASIAAQAAEIRDNPDSEWAPRGNRTAPGWDITISGEISPGDDVAFAAAIDRVKRNQPDASPIIIWLNSPGGDVVTSEHIADLIDHFGLWTHVDHLCASSCFMLFMAGGFGRTFAPDAKIGVHSAYEGQGTETPLSLAMTMMIIRKAQSYAGQNVSTIPPSVIGKLAGTLGTDISWLSRDELQQIGATMDPPENPVSIVHTPTIMQQAKAFADQYAREQPAYTASRGGRDAVLRTWMDSYDYAYSTGTRPLDCGFANPPMPDNDGCRAGARDYLAAHRDQ